MHPGGLERQREGDAGGRAEDSWEARRCASQAGGATRTAGNPTIMTIIQITTMIIMLILIMITIIIIIALILIITITT